MPCSNSSSANSMDGDSMDDMKHAIGIESSKLDRLTSSGSSCSRQEFHTCDTDSQSESTASLQPGFGFDCPTQTLALQNLPRGFKLDDIVRVLDGGGFKGSYDMINMPLDNGENCGFAFINFVNSVYARAFRDMCHGLLTVVPARKQVSIVGRFQLARAAR
eukprot:TRINITY_DN112774_c0_g1_i1.p1 TRINITY_DN112774_c0_g1~~TRINITY_DN112774_c0_g1_i1.p1  ORF type:complete len:161 (+),score=26.70 TRINITY_DN112774_c0_g1_i1:39-521(+)